MNQVNQGRRRFLVASALAPLALAGACSGQPPLTRVGGILWIGYEPLFLARELGLYDADTLRLVEMPSNTTNLMALATGNVEAATLTLDECLLAREGGLDVRAILVFGDSARADVMSRPGFEQREDLKGLIMDVLVARTDALERSPESFRQLLAGHFRALDYLRTAPEDASRRMAPRLGVSPGEVRAALQGIRFMDVTANRGWLDGTSPGLVQAAGNVARIMASANLLRQNSALDGLADPRFLPVLS